MKFRKIIVLISSIFLLGSCDISSPTNDVTQYNKTTLSGEISSFDLTSPFSGYSNKELQTFTWNKANNAAYYNLEIASTNDFVSNDADEVYLNKTNIESNQYTLSYSLPKKETLYYWKVTAYNKDHSKVCNNVFTFYYEADNQTEIKFDLSDPEEFTLHELGSKATIGVDKSNFFGNDEPSLTIYFEEEDTNRGITESDGWMVLTKTEEKELYGTDALFMNFYYSGNDANFLVRIVDYDGEYWHCPVQISNNAKQTVLLKFDQFELRTKDTTVQNRIFNYEHIKYLEFVFEKTFGDGVCYISGLKAVKFNNYRHMFVDKLNFNEIPSESFVADNYDFEEVISDDGSKIEFKYNTQSGYGFDKIYLNKYFVTGDAIRFKVKYQGYKSSSMNFLFRILEEDNDRWQYKQPFSSISYSEDDDYTTLVIPFKAFLKTDYIYGDGAKQFYFIQNIQFGANGIYGSGSFTIKDFEVITIADELEIKNKEVTSNGVIDNFDEYVSNNELYLSWDVSTSNKDEAMILDTSNKTGPSTNKACCELDYKSDMGMAAYSLFIDTTNSRNHNAISLWLKDASYKSDNSKLSYLTEVTGEVTIQLSLISGEYYRYSIPKVNKDWSEYIISFSDFTLINEEEILDEVKPLSEEFIVNFAIGIQYFYYDQNGKPFPVYTSNNPVYIDEIKFTTGETKVNDVDGSLKPDVNNPNICLIEDAEKYNSTADLIEKWSYGNTNAHNNIKLSNDVSSNGGNHSIEMEYYDYNSVSYAIITPFKSTVKGRAILIDMKGDGLATVYINIYFKSGAKFRTEFKNLANTWNEYLIGFDYFSLIEGSGQLISNNVPNISKITIGIVKNTSSLSHINVDNIKLNFDCDYADKTITPIN